METTHRQQWGRRGVGRRGGAIGVSPRYVIDRMADIPVVSLNGEEREVTEKLDEAFRGVGFVFVVHHNIQQVILTQP